MSNDLVKQRKVTEGEGCPEASSLIKWVVETELAKHIEELEANLAEQVEWVKSLADDLIAAEGREARLKDKLAKVISLADAMAEAIEDQIDTCDASMDEQAAVKNYRTTLAELTGGKDE